MKVPDDIFQALCLAILNRDCDRHVGMQIVLHILNNAENRASDFLSFLDEQDPTEQQIKDWARENFPELELEEPVATCEDGERVHLVAGDTLFGELRAQMSSDTDVVLWLPVDLSYGEMLSKMTPDGIAKLYTEQTGQETNDTLQKYIKLLLCYPYPKAKEVVVWIDRCNLETEMMLLWASAVINADLTVVEILEPGYKFRKEFEHRYSLSANKKEELARRYIKLLEDGGKLRAKDACGDVISVPEAYIDDEILACVLRMQPVSTFGFFMRRNVLYHISFRFLQERLLSLHERGLLNVNEAPVDTSNCFNLEICGQNCEGGQMLSLPDDLADDPLLKLIAECQTLQKQEAPKEEISELQLRIGVSYRTKDADDLDLARSAKWLMRAAEAGHAEAQLRIGYYYEKGVGLERDYGKAVRWYRAAAEQGNPMAQNNMGSMYADGAGVEKNLPEACRWWQRAADGGISLSQYNLGLVLFKGTGVEKDQKKAVEWWSKAAEQNDGFALFALGYCYEKGLGVEQNTSMANDYYSRAAEQGITEIKYLTEEQ